MVLHRACSPTGCTDGDLGPQLFAHLLVGVGSMSQVVGGNTNSRNRAPREYRLAGTPSQSEDGWPLDGVAD